MRALPLAFAVSALVIAVVADRAARRRAPARDTGFLWAMSIGAIGLLALIDVISVCAQAIPDWWTTGRHTQFDRALATSWAFPTALAVPLAAWAAVLVVCGSRHPPHPHAARWIAGSVHAVGSRWWVLACGAIPAIVVVFGYSLLDQGESGMSAFTWMTSLLLVVSVAAVALSTGTPAAAPPTSQPARPPPPPRLPMPDWPRGMLVAGITLADVTQWPRGNGHRNVLLPAAVDVEARLSRAGAVGVAPELIEIVSRILTFADAGRDCSALALAPDDCGQAEVVACAASELRLGAHEHTLVISPGHDDEWLIGQLARWLPPGSGDVQLLRPGAEQPGSAACIWLVDVQTLSDRLLERLTDSQLAGRIGLVVWWDVHHYTGVKAANVWAISRRLQRLMRAVGRPGLRTLVLARDAPHAGAQLRPFISRLLPYTYSTEMVTNVGGGFARPVSLYRLDGHAQRFTRQSPATLAPRCRHATLVASDASAELGWPTHLRRPPDVTVDEVETLARQAVAPDTLVRDRLVSSPAEAGARIMHLTDGEVLALPMMLSQGGRMLAADLGHHVAITTSGNPFVEYVLGRVGTGFDAFGSRRLVGAEGHTSIVERHLLAALRELPDTQANLLQTLVWNEKVIADKLDELHRAKTLVREEVRYLVDGVRHVDFRYRSKHPNAAAAHPLDTVGVNLVIVRDPVDTRNSGVRLRVDRERVTIQAYPHRVFVSGGARYRIGEWAESDLAGGWLSCTLDAGYARTWRTRSATVNQLRLLPDKVPVRIGSSHEPRLTRMVVDLRYQESVAGAIRVEVDLTTGEQHLVPVTFASPKESPQFTTEAMVLAFDPPPAPAVLSALSLALACVLPVMLGVEDDALEVVPLHGRLVSKPRPEASPSTAASPSSMQVHGLAIVDLYPNGIGLIEAIDDDVHLLGDILAITRDWLIAEAENRDQPLVRSMLARAVRAVPDVVGAVDLLEALLAAPLTAPTAGQRRT